MLRIPTNPSTRLVVRLRAASVLVLAATGCVGAAPPEPPASDTDTVTISSELQTLTQLRIDLPAGTTPGRFAVAAAGALRVDDRAQVRDSMARAADVANTGATITQLGVSGKIGDLFSQAGVDLRNNARVDGNIVTAGTVTQQSGVVVTGTIKTNTSLAPLASTIWKPAVPSGTGTNLTLAPNTAKTISPGAFAQVTVNAGATLHLKPGLYKLGGLQMESGSKVVLDSVVQATQIYITGTLIYRGVIVDAANANNKNLPLLLAVLGTAAIQIDPVFRGTFFAPNASVSVGPGTHYASFFAKDVELRPDTVVELRRYDWTSLVPATKVTWQDAPVILTASRNDKTGTDSPATSTPTGPVTFTIPEWIYIRTGNAGTGQAELKFKTPTGTTVTCLYHGGARVAHPVTDLERMRGRRYRITSCTNGFVGGQTTAGTWFSVHVISGDSQDVAGKTSVAVHLGGGCSDVVQAPLAAEEVVAMRTNFTWDTMSKLAETDIQGHPALYHAMIYIDSKEQLAALDRMRIFWSAMPISERYMSGLRGKCGRVEHATDGRGVVVYAVIPGRVFNVLRDFGIQALHGNVAPPFKFVVPSPPEQPEFVNSDGTLSYAALGSSRYAEWLASHPGGSAGWFSDAVDFVSDTASDAWDWTKDHIIDPAAHYGEYGFDYIANGFDFAIDFIITFADDAWEGIQQGLQEFVLVFSDSISMHLKITIANRDPLFPKGSPLTRLWGPRADLSGTRPNLVPAGANVRVRQWGWGFLPVMDQAELGEDGQVTLEAVKGASGRGGDLCIEMDTDYAMMTTDFIPNEVCDFAEGKYGNYQDNINDELSIDEANLFSFTQLKDASDYQKLVIGTDPYPFDVLTGWVANELTATIAKKHRAMCLCLDFPGLGASAISSVAAGLAATGALGDPALASVITSVGLFTAALIEKDLWWPDADDTEDTRRSRVITHEYGHFDMCSLLVAEQGPPALTGLIARVFEGQDDSRDDEIAQMTESWADNFALQVVGGANYVKSLNSTDGPIHFCTLSPCMDYNYIGDKTFDSQDDFHDELARFESLIYDAFDRGDSTTRFTNAVANGDYLQWDPSSAIPPSMTPTTLMIAPSPYLLNHDENVNLPAPAWRTWAKHWLEIGLTPDHHDVIGGLVKTMADNGATWCDRCQLVAQHHKDTPKTAYNQDPTLQPPLSPAQKIVLWTVCTQFSDLADWVGPPPAPFLNMNTTSCVPCPLHSRVDASGNCQACPPNSIATANQCEDCGVNVPSSTSEVCNVP